MHQVAHAQQYHFIDYSLEEGLPHSQVESVFQDRDGYLWIGTLGGASRFDGRTFTNYSEQNALLSNQINDIAQDSKGNIWLATIGGLTMFDGTAFISFPFADSLSGENVKDIAIDGFDNIWMAMGAKGLGMFDRHTYLFRSLPEEMRDQYVRTIVLKSDGIWLGTKMGIVKLEGKQFKQLNIEDFKDINVSRICVAENGNVWIATYGSGVFSLSGNKVEHYDATSGLISDWIRDMVQDGHGNFWFASKYGVCKLDVSGSRIMHFSQKNGLKHSNINVLTLDNEGNIWLGSDGGGVIKFAGEEFEHFTADEGLGNGIVMSEVEDNEGNMWFSTYGSGLCRFDGEHFKCYTAIDGLANNTVWTSDKDHKGVLWFGTSEGITSCRNGHFESYSIAEGLIGKKVISLYCDNNGRIWYGTKEGVAVLKHTNGKWSGKSGSGIRKIGHNVRAILQSNDGAMWFGTSEGLYKLLKGKLSHFTEKDGLGNNTVYSICADGRGNLWLGTKGGIVFYNRESDRFNIIGFNDESRSEF
ncbi:MAG: two-component regulator propeller domain-containing protein, partial [Flavobacteriales bacterium]